MLNPKIMIITATSLVLLQGCSHYKSSWSCKNPKGFGCTSIEYADQVARRHIILNSENTDNKKIILINEHYSDFKKHKQQQVEVK